MVILSTTSLLPITTHKSLGLILLRFPRQNGHDSDLIYLKFSSVTFCNVNEIIFCPTTTSAANNHRFFFLLKKKSSYYILCVSKILHACTFLFIIFLSSIKKRKMLAAICDTLFNIYFVIR